jgi:hypothetical protein
MRTCSKRSDRSNKRLYTLLRDVKESRAKSWKVNKERGEGYFGNTLQQDTTG